MPEAIPVSALIRRFRPGLLGIIIISQIIYGSVSIINYLFEVDKVNSTYYKPKYKQGYSHRNRNQLESQS